MPTEAGKQLKALFAARGMTQQEAASASNISQPYLSQLSSGSRPMSAGWVEAVAERLQLTEEERERLHTCAARDHGFKIKL